MISSVSPASDCASATGLTGLDMTSAGTISFYWKRGIGTGAFDIFRHITDSSGFDGVRLAVQAIGGANSFILSLSDAAATSNHNIPIPSGLLNSNLLTHFAFRFNGTRVEVFINGRRVFGLAQARTPTAAGTRNTGVKLDGSLHDLRVYTEALNMAEINAVSRGNRLGREKVIWFRNLLQRDESGNGNTITLSLFGSNLQAAGSPLIELDNPDYAVEPNRVKYGKPIPIVPDVIPPDTARPIVRSTISSTFGAAASKSVVLPTIFPHDLIMVTGNNDQIGTLGQSAGPTLVPWVPGTVIYSGAGKLWTYFVVAADHNGDGGVSTDSGDTLTLTNTDATKAWGFTATVFRGNHLVSFINAFDGDNALNATSLAVPGAVASISNAVLMTIGAYTTNSGNVDQAFSPTVTYDTTEEDNLVIQGNSGATSGQRGRGVGVYESAFCPANGVAASDRTLSFVGGHNSDIIGVSLALAPLAYVQGDYVYDLNYAPGGSHAKHRLDIIYPAIGTVTTNDTGLFDAVVALHGAAGDKDIADTDLYKEMATVHGFAIIALNYRKTSDATVAPAGLVSSYDIKCALRWLNVNGALFNLNNTVPPRMLAPSEGAALGILTKLHATDLASTDLTLGYPTGSELVGRSLFQSGEYDAASVTVHFAADSITPIGATPCSTTSNEAFSYGLPSVGVDPCLLRRFNGADFHGNLSVPNQVNDTDPLLLYNTGSATAWAEWYVPVANDGIMLSHGPTDRVTPPRGAYSDSTVGAGIGIPEGMYQRLIRFGIPAVWYPMPAGVGHVGSAGWNAQPAAIRDQLIWLATGDSGGNPGGGGPGSYDDIIRRGFLQQNG